MTGALDWNDVVQHAKLLLKSQLVQEKGALPLNDGQRASLLGLCKRLTRNGVILADEVGMGKTRIAVALALCVVRAGGRVAIVAPSGLGGQWQRELSPAKLHTPDLLRTYLQYLEAWTPGTTAKPWFREPVVLLSHGFNRWPQGRLPDWRWSLLPEVLARYQKDVLGNDLPYGYRGCTVLDDLETRAAGASIAGYLRELPRRSSARHIIDNVSESIPVWKRSAEPEHHGSQGTLRKHLDRITGLGLGIFDLVVIDEAHKSRGDDSLLSSLLANVLVENVGSRRLAMSATPVELDAVQWQQSLKRIHVEQESVPATIDAYVRCVEALRRSPHDPKVEAAYVAAAANYKGALDPYVLRRDKREDTAVRSFVKHTHLPTNAYRDVAKLPVRLESMSTCWKQAVCAAEALSFVSDMRHDSDGKLQRLTMGNGHGVARLIDEVLDKEEQDTPEPVDSPRNNHEEKRKCRADWWKEQMKRALRPDVSGEDVLYSHPALIEAMTFIESVATDEKVLVFARYREPMQALMKLLNARAMLRSLEHGTVWPQRAIPEDEVHAVRVAHRQLYGREADLAALDDQFRKAYRELESSRQRFRNGLVAKLQQGLTSLDAKLQTNYGQLLALLLESSLPAANATTGHSSLAIVARALSDHLGDKADSATPAELTGILLELAQAAANLDTATDAADDIAQGDARSPRGWAAILKQLDNDYSHASGPFARQLHGGIEPGTRRLLQLAFNRPNAFPRILIAQSMVGREGLNLHESCRTVVLLHLEWNPAVVEQQIGRVDRLGSLWEQKLEIAIRECVQASEVPRIRVRQVVFEGTYDEGHWRVLEKRWDMLRAQLHGDILPMHENTESDHQALRDRILIAAPRFSPMASDSEVPTEN